MVVLLLTRNDYAILGSILGSPYIGQLPFLGALAASVIFHSLGFGTKTQGYSTEAYKGPFADILKRRSSANWVVSKMKLKGASFLNEESTGPKIASLHSVSPH